MSFVYRSCSISKRLHIFYAYEPVRVIKKNIQKLFPSDARSVIHEVSFSHFAFEENRGEIIIIWLGSCMNMWKQIHSFLFISCTCIMCVCVCACMRESIRIAQEIRDKAQETVYCSKIVEHLHRRWCINTCSFHVPYWHNMFVYFSHDDSWDDSNSNSSRTPISTPKLHFNVYFLCA